ncbi:flagellar biosynthetic protein FliO [Pseudidiomarina andamanensis]|uniref:Flagellar protein n=1 Tax=Pseudidiomarina andamanensis TaxID=1940690 RepID=A0AA92EU73_9GAMM|nr:flagellar biosynthetic protein FliO [Pseudidiomarina andamanensis]MDS0218895.1 flagellar biosynthetic protein FliO [Pseudidiomarina andamanensis]QGT96260.1 flagellar biosynthetic protein FliO [Pseudidiomarina andamanensis]
MNEPTTVEVDSGLALLGQVTLVLILIIGIILLCAWLFRKLNGTSLGHSKLLNVVGSVAVGQRERVVIVEINDTWLVLGVAAGHVTKLHEMPAQERPEPQLNSFAARLQQALNKNTSAPSEEAK